MMNRLFIVGFIGSFFTLLPPLHGAENQGEAVVTALGKANGIALFCRYSQEVEEIKNAMMAHTPKRPEYRDIFFDATNDTFLKQTRFKRACPSQAQLALTIQKQTLNLKEAFKPNP